MAHLLHSDPQTRPGRGGSQPEPALDSLLEIEVARARAAWEADLHHYQERLAWWTPRPERWRGFLCRGFGSTVPDVMLRCTVTGVFICWPLVWLFGLLLWKLGHPVDLSLEAGYCIFAAALFSAYLVRALDWCGYQFLAARARKDFVKLPPWDPAFDLRMNGRP